VEGQKEGVKASVDYGEREGGRGANKCGGRQWTLLKCRLVSIFI